MERKDLSLNDDSRLEAMLRTQLAAAPLPGDEFVRDVLTRLPKAPSADTLTIAANEKRRATVQRGWFAAVGAMVGALVFVWSLRGVRLGTAIHHLTDSAQTAVREAGNATATATSSVLPVMFALAATLCAVGFVFWGALRRWAAREWERFA